jgi:hypothetical protein
MLAFAFVRDGAGFDEGEKAVAEAVGMDTEMGVLAERMGDRQRGGGRADAQRALVLDEERDVGGDALVDLVDGGDRNLGELGGGFDEGRDAVPIDRGLAGGAGSRGLTWAMTMGAVSTAARVMSQETPREHRPDLSGGVTWTRATSRGEMRWRRSEGISKA